MSEITSWPANLPPAWLEGCGASVLDIARNAYRTPGRFYHTWDHVDACVETLRTFPCDHPRAVFLALVFHDAVYVAGRADNESLSAQLAATTLREHSSLGADEVTKIHRMILATKSHRDAEARMDRDLGATLDIDMSILGAEPVRYTAYAEGVRREYCPAVVSANKFTAGRIVFLTSVLGSDAIFHTAEGRQRWERRARDNIAREIEELRASQGIVSRLLTLILPRRKTT